MTPNFTFLNLAKLPLFEDALVARVPAKISNTRMLLRIVAEMLSFPAYFGENWNALSDCLRDFHWTKKRNIILIHEDVPNIPIHDLQIYLEVLRDAVSDWRTDESHELIVVFDEGSEVAIDDVLSG